MCIREHLPANTFLVLLCHWYWLPVGLTADWLYGKIGRWRVKTNQPGRDEDHHKVSTDHPSHETATITCPDQTTWSASASGRVQETTAPPSPQTPPAAIPRVLLWRQEREVVRWCVCLCDYLSWRVVVTGVTNYSRVWFLCRPQCWNVGKGLFHVDVLPLFGRIISDI